MLRTVIATLLAQLSVILCASALGGHVIHQLLDPEDPGRVMAIAVATPAANSGMNQAVTAHLASSSTLEQPLLSHATRQALSRQDVPLDFVKAVRGSDGSSVPGAYLQTIVAQELDTLDPAAAQTLRSEAVPALTLGTKTKYVVARYRALARTAALVLLASGLLCAAMALVVARNPTRVLNVLGWGLVIDALAATLLFFVVAPILKTRGVRNEFASTLQLMIDGQQPVLFVPLMIASFAGVAVLIIRSWTKAHYAASNMHLVHERAVSERRQAQRRYQLA